MDLCPGHINRGTGDHCRSCRLPIPPHLRRPPGSLSELRNGCPLCHQAVRHIKHVDLAARS